MSQIVLDRIALELAALPAVPVAAASDLGFGRDLRCVLDVRPDMAEVNPASPLGVGEAAIRRLITARGTLPGVPDYGLDVRAYCSRGVTAQDLRELEGRIRLELAKEERIEDTTVTVTTPSPGALSIQIEIRPADPARDPFPLTFALTASGELTVERIG